jgi:hypothetical protein
MTTNDKALDAFLTAKAEIDALLERLKELSEDNFQTNPERISWADVTTLNDTRDTLRQITDRALREGEYAA